MKALKESQGPKEAVQAVDQLIKRGGLITETDYMTSFEALDRVSAPWKDSLRLFRRMVGKGLTPTTSMYSTLLGETGAGYMGASHRSLDALPELCPAVQRRAILLTAAAGDCERALTQLRAAESNGLTPTADVYTAVVRALGESGERERAITVANGALVTLPADTHSLPLWTQLVLNCAAAGRLEDCLGAVRRMEAQLLGCGVSVVKGGEEEGEAENPPQAAAAAAEAATPAAAAAAAAAATYTAAMRGCCALGQPRAGVELAARMVALGVALDKGAYAQWLACLVASAADGAVRGSGGGDGDMGQGASSAAARAGSGGEGSSGSEGRVTVDADWMQTAMAEAIEHAQSNGQLSASLLSTALRWRGAMSLPFATALWHARCHMAAARPLPASMNARLLTALLRSEHTSLAVQLATEMTDRAQALPVWAVDFLVRQGGRSDARTRRAAAELTARLTDAPLSIRPVLFPELSKLLLSLLEPPPPPPLEEVAPLARQDEGAQGEPWQTGWEERRESVAASFLVMQRRQVDSSGGLALAMTGKRAKAVRAMHRSWLQLHGERGDIHSMLGLLEAVEGSDLPSPTHATYHTVLSCLAQHRRAAEAERVYQRAAQLPPPHDPRVLTAMAALVKDAAAAAADAVAADAASGDDGRGMADSAEPIAKV